MTVYDITRQPVHLGLGASANAEPEFDGDLAWYNAYQERHADDGIEARLVSQYTFDESWSMWEVHPHGAELVLCLSGSFTLLQEQADGSVAKSVLSVGQYAINAPGVWHTADVDAPVTALFVTAGVDTDHKPRT